MSETSKADLVDVSAVSCLSRRGTDETYSSAVGIVVAARLWSMFPGQVRMVLMRDVRSKGTRSKETEARLTEEYADVVAPRYGTEEKFMANLWLLR